MKRYAVAFMLISAFTTANAMVVLNQPKNGVVEQIPTGIRYTSNPPYLGSDTFVITLNGHCIPINIEVLDGPPVAVARAYACVDCLPILRGDCNCDGTVNKLDKPAFTMIKDDLTAWTLTYFCPLDNDGERHCYENRRSQNPEKIYGCYQHNGDMNSDGQINIADYPLLLARIGK